MCCCLNCSPCLHFIGICSLPELAKKREDYATDLEQYEDLVRQMNEHKEALEQKVKERAAELQTTNHDVERMTFKIVALKERVQGQEVSVEDARKMENEQRHMKETLQRVSAQRQKHKEEVWETEAELTKLLEELDGVVNDYNTKLSELLLVLVDPTSASKFKMSVKKQHLGTGVHSLLLGVDFYAEVRSFLLQQKSEMSEQMTKFHRELQDSLGALHVSQEALTKVLDTRKVSCVVLLVNVCILNSLIHMLFSLMPTGSREQEDKVRRHAEQGTRTARSRSGYSTS